MKTLLSSVTESTSRNVGWNPACTKENFQGRKLSQFVSHPRKYNILHEILGVPYPPIRLVQRSMQFFYVYTQYYDIDIERALFTVSTSNCCFHGLARLDQYYSPELLYIAQVARPILIVHCIHSLTISRVETADISCWSAVLVEV